MIKILLLGDANVGKSSLMLSFTEGEFKEGLVGTAGVDYKMKNIQFEGKSLKIQIWDTAGQERFRTITKSYYKGAAGIILVYDVCDQASFHNVEEWLKRIEENVDNSVEILLLGNKIDLINDRVIMPEESALFAEKHGVSHLETTAKDYANVEKAFKQLLSRVLANDAL
jgi:Ras-related protein Rab-1A